MNVYNLFPEWSGGIGMRYAHITTIHTATNKKEQRASIRALPAREVSFKIFETALLTVKQINQLLYTVRSEIAVPVYAEPFKTIATGDLYGLTTVPTEDTQYLFNLQKHGGGVIVYDKTGVLAPEFHTLVFVDSTQIIIDAIGIHLDAAKAIFYPAIVGMLTDFPDNQHITDGLGEMSLTFKEKRTIDADTIPLEYQDSDTGDEWQDESTGTEYQNI